MSELESDVLRERGNSLLKGKNYDGAIRCYSEAMEVDPYNPKLFSNRCTAYLYLQDYEKALQDAKKCVSIDPDWYKGHVQLGSCYMGLKNYKEAINAYKKALPLAESKETVQKLVDKAIEKESQNSLRYRFFGNAVATLNSIDGLLKAVLCIFAVVTFLPFRALQVKLQRLFMSFYLCIVIINIYKNYGIPALRMDYWRRVAGDTFVLFLLPLMSLRNTPAMSSVMIMIALYLIPSTAYFLSDVLQLLNPDLNTRCVDAVNKAMVKVMPEQNWMTRTPAEKKYIADQTFRMASASIELMLLPMSLLELRRGFKGILPIFLMLQYLMLRVTISQEVANTLRTLDITINRLVYHQRCPAFIRTDKVMDANNGVGTAYLWIREKLIGYYQRTFRV